MALSYFLCIYVDILFFLLLIANVFIINNDETTTFRVFPYDIERNMPDNSKKNK